MSYQVPADNPFVGQAGAAPEVYAYGLRNPYRFSFDRQTGDLLIGDVGGGQREEIDWIGAAAARGANFGWACREGTVAGPEPAECPVPAARGAALRLPTSGPDRAVTGGFVVRDPALPASSAATSTPTSTTARSARSRSTSPIPTTRTPALTWRGLASFGEDARRAAVRRDLTGDAVVDRSRGHGAGHLDAAGAHRAVASPVAIGTSRATVAAVRR